MSYTYVYIYITYTYLCILHSHTYVYMYITYTYLCIHTFVYIAAEICISNTLIYLYIYL